MVTLEIERLMMMAVGRQKVVTGEVEWLMVEIFETKRLIIVYD